MASSLLLSKFLPMSIFLSGILISCKKDPPREPNITFEQVTGLTISDRGEIFLATDNGLFSLDRGNGKYGPVENELKQTPLNDLFLAPSDPQVELWLASDSGAYNTTANHQLTQENSGLSNSMVNSLHFDQNLAGYFATPAGLDILSEETWTNSPGLDDLYLKFEITDIGTASNGFIYVTTLGGGIERFKMDVDGISGATLYDTDWTQLESNNIHTVFMDDTLQAYGTDKGAGLHFSEYTKWDWEVYTTAQGLINDTVVAVARDHAENWWFGTKQGVSQFDGTEWTSYTVDTHGLLSNHIRFIALGPDGSVWLATDKGLSQFNGDQFIHFPI